MALNIIDNINANKERMSNLDSKYGPYASMETAINALVPNSTSLYVDNGFTFGVKDNTNNVTEYAFKAITAQTTPLEIRSNYTAYVEQKVNDTKVVLKKADGTVIGYFTLNQAANGDIEITIPGDEQVQANWNEKDTTAKSYIENKPDLSNVVYFEDLPSNNS